MATYGTTVPTGRDNTYSPDEIHRKDDNELLETAFNKDQKKVLDNMFNEASELPEVSADDNGKVLTVVDGAWDKADGEAPELPEVTSDDNGKVLTVVDGAWDKAESGGGSAACVIQFSNVSPTTDKTFREVAAAFDAGLPIYASNSGERFYCTGVVVPLDDSESYGVMFDREFHTGFNYLEADSEDEYLVLHEEQG